MNAIGYALFMTVLPVFIGRLFCVSSDRNPYAIVERWCSGFAAMMAIIYIPALLGIFHKWTLDRLTVVWLVLLAAAVVLAGMKGFLTGTKENPFLELKQQVKAFFTGITIPEVIAFGLSAAHAVLTFLMMHVDDDDVAYVGAVTTAVDTNTLMMFDAANGNLITDFTVNEMNRLVTSPQFAFYAVISKLTGLRPAVICHTMMPPVLTMLFFAAFLLVGAELFKGDRKKTGVFTILTFLISCFSYFSVCTGGTFILIRSWQGKTQIVGLIIPLTLYLFLRIAGSKEIRMEDSLFHAVLMGAACLLTSIGGVFALGESVLLMILVMVMTGKKKGIIHMTHAYLFPALMLSVYFAIGG